MLTEEQKADVAKWFAAGASLDEIQKRMKAEFGVHMTYLDLRLMVADLPQPVETELAAPDDVAADGPAHDGPAREVPAPPRRVALWKGSYHGNHENTLWLFRTIISFLLWFLLWLNLRFLLDVLCSVPCPRASARSVLIGRRPTRSRRSATLPRRWAYRGWLFGTGGW